MNEYTIHVGKLQTIGGGFGVFALRDGRVVSSITGISTIERARAHAEEYHFSFGRAPITVQDEIAGSIWLA